MTAPSARRVFVSGAASWNILVGLDHLPEARSHTIFARSHHETLGGTSAGKALNLAQLGFDVTLKTCLGGDAAADGIRAMLDHPAIRLIDVRDADTPTERHLNLMSDDGGRVSIYLAAAGMLHDPMPTAAVDALHDSAIAVLDLSDHSLATIPVARELGIPIWTDLHDWDGTDAYRRPFAEAADVIMFSDASIADPVPLIERWVGLGKRMVICTRGQSGAIAGDATGILVQPAIPVPRIVDTNGAGDAFFAGALFGHQSGLDPDWCLRFGAIAGALCVQSSDLAAPGLNPAVLLGSP